MQYLVQNILYQLIRMKNRIFIPFVIGYILLCSAIAYLLEPATYHHSYFNAIWWVMTTLTTVGYGDISPMTMAGKSFAIFLYVTGIGLLGLFLGKVIDSFTLIEKLREAGKMKFTGKDHLILVGWSIKAEIAVKEILCSQPTVEIVIIAEHDKSPILTERVHYIQGKATEEETLLEANILEARGVLVFAHFNHPDQRNVRDPLLLDGKTLLIATAITSIEHRFSKSIHVTAEIVSAKHVEMFKHVKVDEFVLSQEMISHIAVRSLFTHGITQLYSQLTSQQYGENMYLISKQPQWKTYRDAFLDLLDKGATLIADGNQFNINQRLDESIPDHSKLYIICGQETYDQILK